MDDFLALPWVQHLHHMQRICRRIWFDCNDIEPRAKHSMPDALKDRFQKGVLEQLLKQGRRAFRGPVALRMSLETSAKTPTHPPAIAKNLLDLLAKPRPCLATRRSGLVYADDRQIQALSVICHHGRATPSISVEAMPLRDLLTDLRLVRDLPQDDDEPFERNYDFDMAIEQRDDLRREETFWRERLGNDGYEFLLRFDRARVQEKLLERAALTPSGLARMYDVTGLSPEVAEIWDGVFAESPLHIRLGELPTTEGTSGPYKQEVERKLNAFRKDFGPLLVPVALEVAVRPPPPSRQGLVQDLDNVVRSYLIPKVIEILKPVSDIAFTLDDDARKSLARFAKDTNSSVPPLTTSVGVTRFDIWRLPPAREGGQGYVQMALVSDPTGCDDLFGQIDRAMDKWEESLNDSPP